MAKKNDYAYVEDVGLFQSREAAMIYDYFLNNSEDGVTEVFDWTRLRDGLFGALSFMEHDDFVLFEIEILNNALAEIQKRTGDLIITEIVETKPDGETWIRFKKNNA
ncbi:MAG TPA: hypothetical protein VKY38_03765 [Azoarcus sp.]|nr:hypothetical protein [Azoarcus sp.]